MILDGTKFKIFNFLGAPVRLSLFFFILLPVVDFDITVFLSIFVAVLVHEMAHAYVANLKGYRVYGIDVDLFAGAASIDANIHQRDSMWVSLAGPASNLLLAVLGLFLLPYVGNDIATTFVSINIFLAVFNLLPIHPMDGGMAFRDFLMINMRDRSKAARIADNTSLVFCVFGFIAAGIGGFFIMCVFFAIFFYQTCKRAGYMK